MDPKVAALFLQFNIFPALCRQGRHTGEAAGAHQLQRLREALTQKAEALCERFHCSRSTFSHTFKKETGRSFRQYLTELRLDYARHLLVYSSLRVGEIAFSIGFSDANYFSNIFKKHEGCSPLEYRRTMTENGQILIENSHSKIK